jgi:PAS domain S-box-containing protein
MRIRTQFIVTMVLFGIILAAISASVVITNHLVDEAHQQEKLANNIAQGASQLNYLANDYVISQENSQLVQWQASYTSFSDTVAGLQSGNPGQQTLVSSIQEESLGLKDVFDNIASSIAQGVTADLASLQISQRRLAVQGQALVTDASRLSQLFDSEEHRLQTSNTVAAFALVGAFIAYFLVNYLVTQRRALKGLATLQAGTAIIGAGNLDFRIPEKRHDEVADLSHAFNRMATDLKTVTASKADLEREISERRKAEATLRSQEEKFRVVADFTYDWEYWRSPDNHFIYVSPSCERITGYSVEEFIRDPALYLNIVHPDDHKTIERHLLDHSSRKPCELEFRIIRKDAKELWIGHVCQPVLSEKGEYLGRRTSNRDITERKRFEEEIKRYNEALEERVRLRTEEVFSERQRLYSVLETLPAYVVLLDKDYHVPFANRFFRERFGESHGQRCYEYLFHRTEPCENCESYKVMKTRSPHHWEWFGPDGRNYDIFDYPFQDADGSPMILEMGIDITERKKAEAALSLAGAYNRSLIEAAVDPLVTIGPDGKITDVNTATEAATGLSRDEIIGTDFSDYFTRPDMARAGYEQVFREGSVRDYPLELRHRYGRVIPVLYNASVYRDKTGKVVGVFAAARDITERRKAEAALKELNETLEQHVAERTAELEASNRELEAFSYSVSHDLRAPLRSMEGFSSALLEDYADRLDDQGRQYLQYVQESSDLMGRLIDDLLKLSRVTRSDMNYDIVDMSELAREVAAELEKAEPDRKLKFKVAPGITAYGDGNLLKLALENLLGNAWKFTKRTGSPRIEMGITEHDGKQAYYIRDNGVGFDMKYANKLFKPFQRLHKATEFAGTGIGLATVQRIIHRHGGEVWAESKVGRGATFYFTLGH